VGMKPTTPSLSTSDLAYPSKCMFLLPFQMQHHKVVIEDQRFRKIHVWGGSETLYEHSHFYGEMPCSSHCILLAILEYDWFDT
jgi:hypothetical protein